MPHPLEGIMSSSSHRAWNITTTIASQRGFYLAGGTGLAIYLHHRKSTDLDFFLHGDFDPEEILAELKNSKLPIAVTHLSQGTLNVLCDSVLVQFLSVTGQTQISPTSRIDTANVAAIPDILAMKLNAILGRAKLRDYFDLMVIDQQTGYPIESGIQLLLHRYHAAVPDQTVATIIRSLGYLDDVEDDATVPIERKNVVDFWNSRSVDVAKHIDRF
ncbi:nucleotidyl transferase AbiEii/AbiGii toxin family protein [Ferrimicrobium acidiphilum]|uniref:nucleotidyl transferase AbiEii/AbiGii toxin family protein n=1 Tax=Ferrimicrobium acidiphilum TaxID=121039 RepID=UPI0023F4A538|nr:nucleotidyl transferase AbiEii/AbiGii toxin family protein [Ferrimicrobium acidiphilum]